MEKTTLYLPKSLKRLLELKARREGRSQAELVREALERYLASPSPKSLGIGEDTEVTSRTAEAWLEKE
ncbi:ribbon-helix-helix domain-containing protein [Thermus sp. PS18]|uniref:ribbon-helix-helix domain-containing protein n=1 Tax=Thermus sp. PS18 TaxID=2849039 RepID=UPI002263B443|nr:CopG family transcriptional regulator [Thermus sp. PS18]UZX14492.1 ribbon-helix-helix domain-containing protein [Thermus sp. PS18]